jgi:hypothetical protein
VTRPAAARTSVHQPRTVTPGRDARAKPSRSTMLTKLTREARERLGPDATERQVAEAAEAARKTFYARLSASGVAARKAALHEALMQQRRSALAFEIVEANRDRRVTRAG